MSGLRYLSAAVALAAVALAAGCGQGLPPAADMDQSREALKAALDAWKAGQSPESLRERTPPVDFRDVAWEKGTRLAKYEVEKEETAGLSARFTVKLYLGDKAGQSPRLVYYNADQGEMIVIRPDF